VLLPLLRVAAAAAAAADITFFGEALPARFHRRRLTDLAQADLLIVMGTSLLVQPFAGMIGECTACFCCCCCCCCCVASCELDHTDD
jgi:NAD-dependent SIR2 family protein deacetylase